jgi:hypothetical protein
VGDIKINDHQVTPLCCHLASLPGWHSQLAMVKVQVLCSNVWGTDSSIATTPKRSDLIHIVGCPKTTQLCCWPKTYQLDCAVSMLNSQHDKLT